jgi:glycosyltransferase involved in cell wall biosynthesis
LTPLTNRYPIQPIKEKDSLATTTPALSIVVPIHNEAAILESVVKGIIAQLADLSEPYELVLYENGSTDETLPLARALAAQHPQVVVLTNPKASYGLAIRNGILHSQGERIVIFNADLWDIPFLRQSNRLLTDYDIVIASKGHPDSHDQRPWNRRLITQTFNLILQLLFGFKGTDTHGMKALKRTPIVPIIQQCVTDGEIFDSELILRGERAGLKRIEVPTVVEETRPSRFGLFNRVPRTLRDLFMLYRALHGRPV